MTSATEPALERLKIVALPSKDCIDGFCCGVREIDKWATQKCAKHQEKSRSRTFCALSPTSSKAAGFYSLSFSAEDPRYVHKDDQGVYKSGVPFIYVQYLAVFKGLQNQGIGTILLIDALKRAYFVSTQVAVYGVALRTLNERTAKLYSKYGFAPVEDSAPNPLMILPIWHLIDLFEGRQQA